MATVMLMHWPQVTKEKYESVRNDVKWETDVPAGAKFHVAWFGDDGLHVLDLWDSPQAFQTFAETRLNAATQRAGIEGQPNVQLIEAHAIFAPNV
jgi:hypothetical protein